MIYLFLADGTEEMEAIAPIDILRRGGFDVKIIGVTDKTVSTSHKISVNCDCFIDDEEIPEEGIEAIIIPGGLAGVINIENCAKVHRFIDAAIKQNALLCAICAGPSILGHKHLLEGRRAIAFPGFEKDLYGAQIAEGESVVIDGNIITAKGAGVSVDFGLKILETLTDIETAKNMAETIQFV